MLTASSRVLTHALLALLCGAAALPAVGTETDLPRSWLLSPYCKGNAPVQKVSIEAREGEFVPAMINVTKGSCVELWIRHAGGVAHNAVIVGTGFSSEAAPLLDQQGRRYGRAVARGHPQLSGMSLKEGWFAPGEQVLVRFQALQTAELRLRCTVAESLSADAAQAKEMSAIIWVSQ